jgi:hypothetical protein
VAHHGDKVKRKAPAVRSSSDQQLENVELLRTEEDMSGDGQAGMSGDGQAGMSGDSQAGMSGDGQAGMSGDGQAGMSGDGQAGMSGDGQAGMSGDDQAGMSGDDQADMNIDVQSEMIVDIMDAEYDLSGVTCMFVIFCLLCLHNCNKLGLSCFNFTQLMQQTMV